MTNRDIAVSLQSILSGIESTEYREDNDLIPVTLRSVAADRQDLGVLETLNDYSQTTGRAVPISQVAEARIVWEPSKILRRDRSKTVTVECNLVRGLTATEVNTELIPWLEEQARDWKIGYGYELGGEIESSVKSQKSIVDQVPIAVLVIVLLDRIRIEIDENGLDPANAIVEAAQRRLRPILLTTATTVGGLLPLWIGGGPMWSSMAIAIIFGLSFATLLTLGIVPVLYSLFYRVSFRDFVFTAKS